MGRSAQSWEVIVMVVMLVCGWTDGQVVSKCALRSRLQKAFLRHPSDVIAKMVCTVEYISVFNTSLVTNNNSVPLGSFIGPQYIEGNNSPTPEVIGDDFPKDWPGTAEPENPSFPPEVVNDGLIPAVPSQEPAVTSVQDNSLEKSGEERSGDVSPTGNGSGESSESKSEDKHGDDSGEESDEDSSGENSENKSEDKHGDNSGEESDEDSSGESSENKSEDKLGDDSGEESGEESDEDSSGESSESKSKDKHGDDSGEESDEDGSGESSGSHSKGKREVDSGEVSGEEGSGHNFSGEESGSGIEGSTEMPPITGSLTTDGPFEPVSGSGAPLEPTTGPLITDGPFEPVSGSGAPLEPTTGPLITDGPFEPVSGSGAPLEPITAISQWDSTDNDFFPDSTDEEPVEQPRYPDGGIWKALFQRELPNTTPTLATSNSEPTEGSADMPNDYNYTTSTIPPLASTNQQIYYDTYEDLFGHTEGSADMPNDYTYPTTTSTIPPLASTNQEIHYDTYEGIHGHPLRKGYNMPNDYEGRPYSYYGPMNPDNGPFGDYEQNFSPRNLYGIFQLSDDVACQSEGRYSQNICNLYCQDLIDSDITDDIDCLMALKQQGMDVMVLEQCQTVEASEYFAECE